MEPKPVQQSKSPSYPTRRDVLAGAATFAAAGLCGRLCVFAATEEGKTIVAPLFEHGEGRGATGCIVVSPPVFLSEEEAMQIIREELGKHGIRLRPGDLLKGVQILHRHEERIKENGQSRIEEIDPNDARLESKSTPPQKAEEHRKLVEEYRKMFAAKPLRLSGLDPERRVAVEFITKANYRDLGGPGSTSTVQDYDFKEVAGYIAAKVKKQGKEPIYLGLFYDPAVRLDIETIHKKYEKTGVRAAWKEAEKESKNATRNLLRLQVRDFVAWLKKQKVIEDSSK
jgi:hypothetical protein